MSCHPFHGAACAVLGLDPDAYGSQSAVADKLGVARSQYSGTVRRDRAASLDLLCRWAGQLGMTVIVSPGGVKYLAAPLDHARAAIALVERIPALLEHDHPTAHAEVDHVARSMGDLVRWLDVPGADGDER